MTWKSVVNNILIYIIKVLVVVLLIGAAFIGGAMIGYSVIGEAGDPMDVFNPDLWRHILEFIF